MKFGFRKSLIIYLSLSSLVMFGLSAHASVVDEVVSRLATDFVDVSEPVAVVGGAGGVSVAGTTGAVVMGGVEAVPAARASTWLSKKPVSQALFVKVLGNNPSIFKESKYCAAEHVAGANPMCPNLAVDGVRYYSAGESDSIDEFLDALNDRARSEGSPYRFRLPVDEEFLRSVAARSVILTGLTEWTASRALKPFISKLVIQYKPFHLKSALHQEIILDEASVPQLERKYLHPEFFSEKTRLGFRLVVETKPAIAGALDFSE